eukprot:3092356-Pleurochrysis_carterae.AAC.1
MPIACRAGPHPLEGRPSDIPAAVELPTPGVADFPPRSSALWASRAAAHSSRSRTVRRHSPALS